MTSFAHLFLASIKTLGRDETSIMKKLKLIWRILRGQAVMYKVEVNGGLTLTIGQNVWIAECIFN